MRPRETWSIKVGDFGDDFKILTIRDEIAKNKYGRTIYLKLSTALIKDYINFHSLKDNDFLFQKNLQSFNKYLKRLSAKLFGSKISHPKTKGSYNEKFAKLTEK